MKVQASVRVISLFFFFPGLQEAPEERGAADSHDVLRSM